MIHIILNQDTSRAKFLAYAESEGWEVLAEFDADPEHGQAGQIICNDPEIKVKCYYVEDYLIDLRYLIIEGKPEKELLLASKIYKTKNIDLVSASEIFHMIEDSKNEGELVLGLRMLAVISPTSFDQKFYKLFAKGLQHEDPYIRHAAIQIVTYPAWPEFKRDVANMKENDPSEMVRERAEGFLKAYTQLFEKKKKKTAAKKKKAKVSAKAKAKAKAKVKAKAKSKTKVKVKAKTKSKTKVKAKAKTKVSSSTKSKLKAKTKAKTKVKAKTKGKSKKNIKGKKK